MAGIEFLINIQQRMNQGNAVTELQRTQQALNGVMDRYADMDAAARKAEQAIARNAAAQDRAGQAMKHAMSAGDPKSFWKAAQASEALKAAQGGLQAEAENAKGALEGQAKEINRLVLLYERLKTLEKDRKGEPEVPNKDQDKGEGEKFDSGDLAVAGRALGRLGGPLGEVGQEVGGLARGWNKLAGTIGTTGATIAAATVLFVAVAAAIAYATEKLLAFGIASIDANRNFEITLDAMNKGANPIGNVGDAFHKITLSTGLASDRLLEITKSLREAHIPAAAMPDALEAIAKQESALGDSSGTEKLIQQLQGGAKSASQLAKEMDGLYGEDAQKRALNLTNLSSLFKENLQELFGTDEEGLLKGLRTIVELFDKDTVAGKGLQMLLAVLFGPFLANGENAGQAVERAFIKVEIAVFDIAIALQRADNWIKKTFHTDKIVEWDGVMFIAKSLVFGMLAGLLVLGVVGAASIALLSAQFKMISKAVDDVEDTIDDVKRAFRRGDWEDVGKSIVQGVAKGISDGGWMVASAATGVVGIAIKAAYDKSESHSPSKVFQRLGFGQAQGLALGMDEGAALAEKSAEEMVEAPSVKVSAPRSGGKSAAIQIDKIEFHGVESVEDGAARFAEKLADVLEGWGFQIGAEAT